MVKKLARGVNSRILSVVDTVDTEGKNPVFEPFEPG